MAEKQTYDVHRSMHGDGRDYVRGDTREMSATDAAPLVEAGALSEEGQEPLVREAGVRHTFGSEVSAVSERGYTTATGEGVIVGTAAVDHDGRCRQGRQEGLTPCPSS